MERYLNLKTSQKVVFSSERLLSWLKKNGWAGYDPFIVHDHPFFRWIIGWPGSLPLRVVRRLLFEILNICPSFWFRVLKCEKQINAKAMALFAKSYLNLYKKTGNKEHLDSAKYCLKWLEENPSLGYSGLCWGYPFDWQSYYFIPKGTPSSVVTFTVGDAFWDAYKLLKDKKFLDVCNSICFFFKEDLNKDIIGDDMVCFNYTPIDKMHVHNANLFVAEFLIRIGSEMGNEEFVKTGLKATNYTVKDQRFDGAWYYYNSNDSSYTKVIDHFHTGFVLRTLYSIYELTKEENYLKALEKGFAYYLQNLFASKTIPKSTNLKTYPVDIHACTEGIICLNRLKKLNPSVAEGYLSNLLNWTINNMQSKRGYFYYMKKRFLKVKIPYIRWGQAWMLLALSEVY